MTTEQIKAAINEVGAIEFLQQTCQALNEIGDPVSYRVASELAEVILAHTVVGKGSAADKLLALLFSR
jgi:uncharacterized membrane protein